MIAVTCRNGEPFSIDPDAIARVETTNDTVVHMVDGSKYVLGLDLDQLIIAVREHRAAAHVVRSRLVERANPAASRHAQRARGDGPVATVQDRSES